MINWGGWKSLTKKFQFTQNLHKFERIRAIWGKISESLKIIFQICKIGGLKWLVKNRNFGNPPLLLQSGE